MAKYLETVYVSGWQSSSTASSSLEPGPDLADYPSNTVPLKVAQLFTAQLFHDRKQRFTRLTTPKEQRGGLGKPVDYLRPIVADADTVSLESGRVESSRAGLRLSIVLSYGSEADLDMDLCNDCFSQGHGGLTAVMKLAKMMVEAGAAGIHIEDQAREYLPTVSHPGLMIPSC
jgi:isocitrate lyase